MAENNMFELKIISPEEMFYEGEGSFLEFTSVGGEMGVYKNHIPLTTILEPCVMKIHKGTEVKKVAVLGGFVEILQEKITVLAEGVQWPGRLTENARKERKHVLEKGWSQRKQGMILQGLELQ